MSVSVTPIEPNARRIVKAMAPVFIAGSSILAAVALLLTLGFARLAKIDADLNQVRSVPGQTAALVAAANTVLETKDPELTEKLKTDYADWSNPMGRLARSFIGQHGRASEAGRAATAFEKAQDQLRSDFLAVTQGKAKEGITQSMQTSLDEITSSINVLAKDRTGSATRPIQLTGLAIVLALLGVGTSFLMMKALIWRLTVVMRYEMRDVLEDREQAHQKDLLLTEEKATQALRAKQADLEAQSEALRIALNKAEESNLVKTAFLGNISHEIRTPLNGILGTSEILAQTPLDEDQKDMVQTIVASGDHLTRIIGDIIDLAQMEAGRFQLEISPFNLHDLTREVVQPYSALASAKGVNFKVILPEEESSTVSSDPIRVRQVLANLVSNAAKFTHKGHIEVRIETIETGEGNVELRMIVSDTGIGIDSARLPSIFEHFNQADNSSKRTYGGAGLGLTIAKQLVEVLGGQIGVDSERGAGSRFWVAIPVQQSSREAIPVEQAPIVTEIPHLGMKILVAEDNLVNQKMMQRLLQRCGCSVDLAENGAEAVERAMFGQYDVILMDVHMPVMDGVESTIEIRRKEREWSRRRTPIIAVTADVMEERRRKFLEVGMDGFVPKPVRLATLLPVLEQRSREAAKLHTTLTGVPIVT
jgi:signal transduction histidine kinase/ActR/RegA family two-component response regulator